MLWISPKIRSLNTWLLTKNKWHLPGNKCHLLKISPSAPHQGYELHGILN